MAGLGKNCDSHLIDANGKDTVLAIAVKSNILVFNLAEKEFVCSYEGHANEITNLKFMDYTVDQKKEVAENTNSNQFDFIPKEYLLSIAENESFANVWRFSKSEISKTITAPAKMLDMSDSKSCIGLQMKQLAGHFYFAAITTSQKLLGYICNMKSKDGSIVKKTDMEIAADKEVIKKGHYILKSEIINESELVILKGSQYKMDIHYVTYLKDDGKCNENVILYKGATTSLTKENTVAKTNGEDEEDKNGDVKMMGLEHDIIDANSSKLQSGLFNGLEIDDFESKVNGALKIKAPSKKIKTGSMVAVLEQSLHTNDIETIKWVLSNTDLDVISQTVSQLKKESLELLLTSLMIRLQQGAQKASLLWLGTALKLRWLDIMKFQHSIRTVHSYLCRKAKNLPKYYELQAKLQMVVD